MVENIFFAERKSSNNLKIYNCAVVSNITCPIDSENSIVNHSPKAFRNYEKLERKKFRQANRYEKWLLTVKDEITILKLNISPRHRGILSLSRNPGKYKYMILYHTFVQNLNKIWNNKIPVIKILLIIWQSNTPFPPTSRLKNAFSFLSLKTVTVIHLELVEV